MGATNNKYRSSTAILVAVTYAAVMSAEVWNEKTVVTVASMTGAGTLNLEVNERTTAGDTLLVKASADATGRTLTFGTGFTAAPYAIASSKSVAISFVYDGSKFVQAAAPSVLN
jgi:hypothetical protein